MYVLVRVEIHPGCNNSPFRVESVQELLTFVSLIFTKSQDRAIDRTVDFHLVF